MLLITPETRIADTVIAHPEIITVLNRFGIDLGLGDNTLAGLCRATDVNPEFLASILNTFLNNVKTSFQKYPFQCSKLFVFAHDHFLQ